MSATDSMGDLEMAARLFKVLGNETRLRLLVLVDDEPCTVGGLVDRAGVSQPLASQHLRTLREAGLVSAARAGREVTYTVADHHVTHVVRDALEHVREEASHPGPGNPKEPS